MSALHHEMTLMITTESLAYGAFVVDDTHRIVSWNEAATRVLGYDAEATLGRSCEEMLHLLGAQHHPVCPAITDASYGGEAADEPVALRVITQYGTSRRISMSVMRARTLAGTSCVVHVFRDVTQETSRNGRDRYDRHNNRYDKIASHSAHLPGGVLHLPLESPISGTDVNGLRMSQEHLTRREHEVLELLARGMTTIEIATRLGISRVTARNHVTRVIEKLGVKTRLQAVLAASRLGLI